MVMVEVGDGKSEMGERGMRWLKHDALLANLKSTRKTIVASKLETDSTASTAIRSNRNELAARLAALPLADYVELRYRILAAAWLAFRRSSSLPHGQFAQCTPTSKVSPAIDEPATRQPDKDHQTTLAQLLTTTLTDFVMQSWMIVMIQIHFRLISAQH